MSSFTFNFDVKPASVAAAPVVREEFKGRVGWILPKEHVEEEDSDYNALNLDLGIQLLTKNGHSQSKMHQIAKDTEVVPLVYEGGFKIWECSFDIISILAASAADQHPPMRILDLGCGAGIVGIWCLKRFPQCHVTFHDLNDTVLEQVTMPNVRRNLGSFARTKFCCGPWHLADGVDLGKYDLIVSGDTMYNVDALPDLISILCRTLKSDGRAVLAAKRYYFGVGGGSSTFCSMVKTTCKDYQTLILTSVTDGSSNIRDVVEFKMLQ